MKPVEAHVMPVDDLAKHECSSNCICGPVCDTDAVKRKDGGFGLVYIHNMISPMVETKLNA